MNQSLAVSMKRSHEQMLATPAATPRESKLIAALIKQDEVTAQLWRILIAILVGGVVGVLLFCSLLLMGSAWEHRRYLQAIDHLDPDDRTRTSHDG